MQGVSGCLCFVSNPVASNGGGGEGQENQQQLSASYHALPVTAHHMRLQRIPVHPWMCCTHAWTLSRMPGMNARAKTERVEKQSNVQKFNTWNQIGDDRAGAV